MPSDRHTADPWVLSRRKKSKCSGEQPTCASCARLARTCFYANEEDGPSLPASRFTNVSDSGVGSPGRSGKGRESREPSSQAADLSLQARVASLESALREIVQSPENHQHSRGRSTLEDPLRAFRRGQGYSSHFNARPSTTSSSVRQPKSSSELPILPGQTWGLVAELYLTFCWCQPLPLFEPSGFIASFSSRQPEVIYAVSALAIKHVSPSQAEDDDHGTKSAGYAQVAYQLVMRRIAEGEVELPTIQAICLLALFDIDAGNMSRCRMLCALASSLCHAAGLHSAVASSGSLDAGKERHMCFWSVVLLCRLVGEQEQLTALPDRALPPFPDNRYSPPTRMREIEDAPSSLEPSNIMQVLLTLSEPWAIAMRYIRNVRNSSGPRKFPWEEGSEYSRATESLMSIGRKLPLSHRQRNIKLSEVKAEDLEECRYYWAPWLCTRLMYHTIMCILNHPLLITLQIQGVQNVSEAFLHHAAFSISNHVSWVIHYLDFIDARAFQLSDPLAAYCVAVVASIEVQRGFALEGALAIKTKLNFKKCSEFISKMNKFSPFAERSERSLARLVQESSSRSSEYVDRFVFDSPSPLDILEVLWSKPEAARERPESSILGPNLVRELNAHRNHSAEAGPKHLPRIDPTSVERTPLDRASSVRSENAALAENILDINTTSGNTGLSGLGQPNMLLPIDHLFHNAFQGASIWPEGLSNLVSEF
ncbi:unnamed protein product [Clonostachys byssicola]|uniref:Transcription factor domain-containing protein n=1 Tax=Clonostachys byssicola TaxID=160290 RepID=A0A9N9UFQ5_9HYPO|nr:unnamed protein product [Clonostachys byssicola]